MTVSRSLEYVVETMLDFFLQKITVNAYHFSTRAGSHRVVADVGDVSASSLLSSQLWNHRPVGLQLGLCSRRHQRFHQVEPRRARGMATGEMGIVWASLRRLMSSRS